MSYVTYDQEVQEPVSGGWTFCFQRCVFRLEDGSAEDGYRFIWRRPDGTLQDGREQVRIPSAELLYLLTDRARIEGWFS